MFETVSPSMRIIHSWSESTIFDFPVRVKLSGAGVVYDNGLSFHTFDKRILNPNRLVRSKPLLVEED